MKIQLKSKTALLKYLGQLDGLIQFNEIALKEFQLNYDTTEKLKTRLKNSVKEIKVLVSYGAWPHIYNRYYTELLTSIYSAFEMFYDNFRKEIQTIFPEKTLNFDLAERNKLKRLAENYEILTGQPPAFPPSTREIFGYYHKVRTLSVHPERIETAKVDGKYKEINSSQAQNSFGFSPSQRESINFSDYILFTKVTKKIAAELTSNLPITPKHISALIPPKINNVRLSHRPRARQEYLRRNYGLDDSTINEIVSLI